MKIYHLINLHPDTQQIIDMANRISSGQLEYEIKSVRDSIGDFERKTEKDIKRKIKVLNEITTQWKLLLDKYKKSLHEF